MGSGQAEKTGVTVVICCYNSAGRLPETLRHLALQEVPVSIPWEIILVDNASDDDSAGIGAREWLGHSRRDVPLTVLDEQRPGKNHALEKGIGGAAYDHILICDDDNWLNAHYVKTAYDVMRSDQRIGAAGGQSTAVSDAALPIWFKDCQYAYAVGTQYAAGGDISEKRYLWGAGMIFKKELYQRVYRNYPSFLTGPKADSVSRGEDVEFCIRVIMSGYKLYYDEALVFRHYMPAGRLTTAYRDKLLKGYERERFILTLYAKQLQVNSLSAVGKTGLLIASLLRYTLSKSFSKGRWSADFEAEMIYLLTGARLRQVPIERIQIKELSLRLAHVEHT